MPSLSPCSPEATPGEWRQRPRDSHCCVFKEDSMGQVQDKIAIVTGGASGIGAACAELLAREGAKVLVTDLDDARGSTLVDKIKKCGGEALYWHHDVSEEQGWLGVIAVLERHYGRLDILVANAGIVILGGAIDMPLADWRRLMTINVDGVF